MAVRQRPRAHDGRTGSESAIFAATEALLAEKPLQDLTVADIIARAELSRANFYHYFASKYDVLAALVTRVLEDTYDAEGPWSAPVGRPRARAMAASIPTTVEMWSQHGPVICAAIETMHVVPQVAQAWQAMRERFVTAVAEQIAHERADGRAPDGPAPDLIATVLVSCLERTFYVGTRGLDPRLPTAEAAADAITQLTRAAIYGPLPAIAPPVEQATPVRDGDDDTASGLLTAIGSLLTETSLDDLSVAQVCERAGASRATFYFYFASKEDAFAALFQRVAEPLAVEFEAMLADSAAGKPRSHGVVSGWLTLDAAGVAVLRNAVHEWPRRPELGKAYLASQDRLATALERVLVSRRRGAKGAAPAQLAATVLWLVEKALAGTLAQERHLEDTPTVIALLDALVASAVEG